MNGRDDSGPRGRGIDAAAKAAFLAALAGGARREDAAGAAGFSLMGFYGARRRDPAFAAAWEEALRGGPAADRRTRAYADRDAARDEIRIAPANRRLLQRRRRYVRFDLDRQAAFIARFMATCDAKASAAAAGVSESTVHHRRRTDPAFAEAWREALALGLPSLEAEALRLRLLAQQRFREALDSADPAARPGAADIAAEFDRTMKLLARHDRKARGPETRFKPGGRRRRATFDDAIDALDRRLDALAVPLISPDPNDPRALDPPSSPAN